MSTKEGTVTPLRVATVGAAGEPCVPLLQDKECLEVAKDTEREDALKSMAQAWEAEQPGRRKKVSEADRKVV